MSVNEDISGHTDSAARESIKGLAIACGALVQLLLEKDVIVPGELERAIEGMTPVFDQEYARMRDESAARWNGPAIRAKDAVGLETRKVRDAEKVD